MAWHGKVFGLKVEKTNGSSCQHFKLTGSLFAGS